MPSGRPPQPLRVLIASGDALVARRLLGALEADERVAVVGTALSSRELEVLAAALAPDVVLLDLALSPQEPLVLLDAIMAAPEARAILLVEGPVELDWNAPAASRIIAFVGRDRPPDEIAEGVVEVTALALAFEPGALEPTLS